MSADLPTWLGAGTLEVLITDDPDGPDRIVELRVGVPSTDESIGCKLTPQLALELGQALVVAAAQVALENGLR